jgi:hypothetical protein
MASTMGDLTQQAGDKIGEMLGVTGDNQESLGGGLKDIIQNVVKSQVDEIVNEVTAKVQDELKDLLGQAMDVVSDTLKGLAGKIFDSGDQQKGSQDELKPIFDMIDAIMEPIQSALSGIMDAASMVGLSFE